MLKPLLKRVVLKSKEVEEKTAGGLVLPSSAQKEDNQIGEIVAIGSDIDEKDVVKVGDTVVYKPYSATKVDQDGEEFYIVDHEDILAIVE